MNKLKITQSDLFKAYFGNKSLLKEISLHLCQNWAKSEHAKVHWTLAELAETLGIELDALKLATSRFGLKGDTLSREQIDTMIEMLRQKTS